jgi:hypothetical protein
MCRQGGLTLLGLVHSNSAEAPMGQRMIVSILLPYHRASDLSPHRMGCRSDLPLHSIRNRACASPVYVRLIGQDRDLPVIVLRLGGQHSRRGRIALWRIDGPVSKCLWRG